MLERLSESYVTDYLWVSNVIYSRGFEKVKDKEIVILPMAGKLLLQHTSHLIESNCFERHVEYGHDDFWIYQCILFRVW